MKLKRRIADGFRPFLWLLADAALVGAIAWPAAALLLFLVNPELPFTPGGFLATMVAILPQALLVFVIAGPLLVLLGNAFAVGRSSTAGFRLRHVARFAFLDAFLLWLAAFDQWRITGPLLPDATRAALAITVSALGAAWVIALGCVVMDLKRPGSVRAPWLVALAVAVLVALAGAGDMRRVRFPDPVPIDVRGFAPERPLILFEAPGLTLDLLEGYAERGTAPALETLLKSGTVATVDGGIVEEPLALHATLVTGRGPEQHRVLGPLRYRPRLGGGGVSFGILPRGLLFWPSLRLGLWEAVPVTGAALRAVSLSGVARALGLPVAVVGDPLSGRPPNADSVVVPQTALRAGDTIALGAAGSVLCASAGPVGERFFDPPAAELPGTRALEGLVRAALEADLCALAAGRELAATGRFALVHVRLGGLER
ncbi:MAG: alkaline phosphatase family protein, partial [Acidobacteria bacterium]|nr:alkaline phosphatase family protein [Acidobacteriota bacterium]